MAVFKPKKGVMGNIEKNIRGCSRAGIGGQRSGVMEQASLNVFLEFSFLFKGIL